MIDVHVHVHVHFSFYRICTSARSHAFISKTQKVDVHVHDGGIHTHTLDNFRYFDTKIVYLNILAKTIIFLRIFSNRSRRSNKPAPPVFICGDKKISKA